MKIVVEAGGPYRVTGGVPLNVQTIGSNASGESVSWIEGQGLQTPHEYRLCRCGHSKAKPFCDGSHAAIGFDGSENPANMVPYTEQASVQEGPTVRLSDAAALCAFARFCDVAGSVWNLVQSADSRATELAIQESELCPSGRLVAWERRAGAAFEPTLDRSIGIVRDPIQGVAGPLWVRGGIPVTASDGARYETRNRMTLCRCGASRNKPFCDGSHAAIGFRDAT